ncbi:cinnamoyl-CoA reductase 1-like isoform X2 [Euphorbia lathyris]
MVQSRNLPFLALERVAWNHIYNSQVIQRLSSLTKQGRRVHAYVQNHDKLNYFEERKNLKVFYSDPFDFQSIMNALKGCCGLFYSFEPPSDQPTYDEMMADVEIRAAHNVLEACGQTDTIYKVVFTSSATALLWSNDRDKALDVDERIGVTLIYAGNSRCF